MNIGNKFEQGNKNILSKYDKVGNFSKEGIAWARLNNKEGFIDQSGKEIIPFEYESCSPFSNGLAKVKKDGKYGFIDQSNNVIIPFGKYEYVTDFFAGGLARVRRVRRVRKGHDEYGLINKEGKEVVPFGKYDYIENEASPSESLLKVRKDGKYGLIDTTSGKEIILSEYDKI